MIPDELKRLQVKTNVFRIPERLRAFDKNLFVTRCGRTYTVWRESDSGEFPQRIMSVDYTEFDDRVEKKLRQMDAWSNADMFDTMDENNYRLEKHRKEAMDNNITYAAKEMSKVGTVEHHVMGVGK